MDFNRLVFSGVRLFRCRSLSGLVDNRIPNALPRSSDALPALNDSMERRASSLLCRLLLCAAVCTACGALATSLLPLSHHGGSTAFSPSLPTAASAASASSTASARPLVWKGTTFLKYTVKLRPTMLKGKLVGDAGASGKIVYKGVR
ncbi:unnamed protein product [Closterium sp. Yama58-4]|nr:unnamed protein product [Closterium sp. Yama58-4]